MKRSGNSTASSTKERPNGAGTPLYVHIPFCTSKCHYCDFNSYPLQGKKTLPYMGALAKEIEARAPKHPRTIFIGGGTPSILSSNEIRSFLTSLQKATGFPGKTQEVSFECNPESLTPEKARILRELGVNRISIGIQSFNPRILKFYDRVHDAPTALDAYAAAREAGFDNINIDLIFGAPGQTLAEWVEDLEQAIELGPDHISAYDLIYEKGTNLRKWKDAGRVNPNEEDTQKEMYRYTMARLQEAGYERYEISNYARGGKQCLHNINYWKNGSYIGVGAGAVSYFAGKRVKNPSSVQAYIQAIESGGGVFEEEESLGPVERLGETMMMRLRIKEGVSRSEVLQQTGFDLLKVYAKEISEMTRENLVYFESDHLRLTERGLLLGDLVASRFL